MDLGAPILDVKVTPAPKETATTVAAATEKEAQPESVVSDGIVKAEGF